MKKTLIIGAALLSAVTMGAQKYNMVIHTTDGKTTTISTEKIASVTTAPQPDFKAADFLYWSLYSTNPTTPSKATYRIDFGTGPGDENGHPAEIGDVLCTLLFTAPASEDENHIILPAGNYSAGNGNDLFTWDVSSSSLMARTGTGTEDISMDVLVDGYVDVDYQDGEYIIRAEVTGLSGAKADFQFEGPVKFNLDPSNYKTFDEDQNVTFDGGQGRFYGNWYFPFADDLLLQFYDGEFSGNTFTKGYWLDLDIYVPKAADPSPAAYPSPVIADGVYTVDLHTNSSAIQYAHQPFTIKAGFIGSMFGQVYHGGTTLTYTDPEGTPRVAHINGGTVTVSGNGTHFAFDCETLEGIRFTGSYSNKPTIVNYCDNFDKKPARPFSTLDASHQLNFVSSTVAIAYNMGEGYVKDGLSSTILMLTDVNQLHGDFLTFDVFTQNGELVDGTYKVDDAFAAFSAFRGRCDYGGNIIYSWYGDLDSADEEGYQTRIAPIDGGTFTIATDGDGVSTITFNLKDDKGNDLTGSWTGTIVRTDHNEAEGAAQRSLRVR